MRSTVFISSGVAHRALFGKAEEDMGGAEPFERFGGAAFMLATALFGGSTPFEGPPVAGVATILAATLGTMTQRSQSLLKTLQIARSRRYHVIRVSIEERNIGFEAFWRLGGN